MNILQNGEMPSWTTNSGETNRQSTSSPPQNLSYGQQLHHQQLQNQLAQQQPIGSPLLRQLQQSPPVGKLSSFQSNSNFQNQSLLSSFVTSSASATDLLFQQAKLLENDGFGENNGSSQSLTGACNNMTTTQMINSLGLSSQNQQHLSNF